ncbi:unnamed protein product [Urochloa decumbens]|uniref:F-box domain-containing protein n=1 Tax=Urochloa decumbens TaxID=240449 RepID=A0ABC9APF7_9POAL
MDDGEDRISGLPDELLHAILARLGSPSSAVRTGVLSRRWRHLWAPQPELVLGGFPLDAPLPPPPPPPLAAFLDAVDGALAACAAPTLELLYISPPPGVDYGRAGGGVPAGRLEPWLRFASERVVGTILLLVPPPPDADAGGGAAPVLDLPVCEGVTTFDLSLEGDWRLRPSSAGVFRALTDLRILSCRIEASELAALVSTQCPCLTDLTLTSIALVKVELGLNAPLMGRFDEVDELKMAMFIPEGIAAYRSFLNETNNLPKCNILTVSSGWDYHGLVPGMFHLLRSCSSTRKVFLLDTSDYAMRQPCVPACPCLLEESHKFDDISLNLLEEVEITSYTSYHGALEFLEQLSRCNAPILKKIVLKHNTISALPTKEICEKILSMWQPNIEVESYLFLDRDWVRLY